MLTSKFTPAAARVYVPTSCFGSAAGSELFTTSAGFALGSDFYDVLNWKTNYKTITVKRLDKIDGEEVYVVEKRSEKGTPITDYISTKSFLLLRRDSVIVIENTGVELPVKQTFADYRKVDGVMVPFKTVSNNAANGDIVIRILDVKFDVEIADSVFRKPASAAGSNK